MTALTGEKYQGAPFEPVEFIGRQVKAVLGEGKDAEGNPSPWPEVKSVTAAA